MGARPAMATRTRSGLMGWKGGRGPARPPAADARTPTARSSTAPRAWACRFARAEASVQGRAQASSKRTLRLSAVRVSNIAWASSAWASRSASSWAIRSRIFWSLSRRFSRSSASCRRARVSCLSWAGRLKGVRTHSASLRIQLPGRPFRTRLSRIRRLGGVEHGAPAMTSQPAAASSSPATSSFTISSMAAITRVRPGRPWRDAVLRPQPRSSGRSWPEAPGARSAWR